jgi:WD40 repeat protein
LVHLKGLRDKVTCCLPRSGQVTHLQFTDADTLVSASKDGTPHFWDVGTGVQKEEMQAETFTFSKRACSKEETVGSYLISVKDDVVLVHTTDEAHMETPYTSDDTAPANKPVAFFLAPAPITTLTCAGDKIAVGCSNGEVLQLRAAWLLG